MATKQPRLHLGPPVDPPIGFKPDRVWTAGPFVYRLDTKLQICQRRAIMPEGQGQGGFFMVSLPASRSKVSQRARKPKPKSRSRAELPKPAKWVNLPQATKGTRAELPKSPAIPKKPAVRIKAKFAQTPRKRRKVRFVARAMLTLAMLAGALVVYPYFPEAKYVAEQSLPHNSKTEAAPVSPVNRLLIPKIGVTVDILEAPDLSILDQKEGVWHQTGSLVGGNMVLAGHRWKYLPPNGTTFYNLNKLTVGDTVIVDWSHQRYVYVVKSVDVIPATKTEILLPSKLPQLTLYTCNDKRQTQRVSVVAEALP